MGEIFVEPRIEAANLEGLKIPLDKALDRIARRNIVSRIWDHDWTVWEDKDKEISNRLGWLEAPGEAKADLADYERFVQSVREDGFEDALLMGMGGSSLAPEVFSKAFRRKKGFLRLHILDSTSPHAVRAAQKKLNLRKTLFIVSSKSGTTVETLSFFHYFYSWVAEALGEEEAGRHFVAVSDPGTPLVAQAGRYKFRRIFFGKADIGGRFSAFSAFGLVPAALLGIDLRRLLEDAVKISRLCRRPEARQNPGAWIGAFIGEAAGAGLDKLTFIMSDSLETLFPWLEQLIAESTGKDGKGILPVLETCPLGAGAFGRDRIFVLVQRGHDIALDRAVSCLKRRRLPFIRFRMDDSLELAGHFFLWEMATAVAGNILGLNPFDQPNVESAKRMTKDVLKSFYETGVFTSEAPKAVASGIRFYSARSARRPEKILTDFVAAARERNYLVVQAFMAPTPKVMGLIHELVQSLRQKTRVPVTLGFGPRYLHSTGQLHKGDGGSGLFLQLVDWDVEDVAVPDIEASPCPARTFGALKAAQAWGDYMALRELGRKIVRLDLGTRTEHGLRKITAWINESSKKTKKAGAGAL